MMSTQMPKKMAIILSSPSDWDEWLEVLKTKAIGGKIWQFVDPSVPKESLPVLTELELPQPADINNEKTTVAELDNGEKEELKFRRHEQKRQQATYDKQDAAMASLRTFIQETVSRTYLRYTFKCDSPYEMLIALKKRVAPTDRARKLELINWYQKMKKAPKIRT